jgi:integrase
MHTLPGGLAQPPSPRRKNGLPKYCCWHVDRFGKRRVRFRKRGFSTYLVGIPWSEDFMRRYASALEGVHALEVDIGAGRTKAGSFNELCVKYYRSAGFKNLRPSSQYKYRSFIEAIRAGGGGDALMTELRRDHIVSLVESRAREHGKSSANDWLKTVRVLLNFALDEGLIDHNPALGIKRYRIEGDGHATWTEADVASFKARHAHGTMARLALELLLNTGQRRGDIVGMGRQHVRDGRIAVRQQKTGTALVIPIGPDLAAALASVPRTNMAFLLSERGTPFTAGSFGKWFRQRCNEAGVPQKCSAHGLRKLMASRLADAGCTLDEIKAITGHRSASEVLRYTEAASQVLAADRAIAKLRMMCGIDESRTQEIVQLPNRSDKTWK